MYILSCGGEYLEAPEVVYESVKYSDFISNKVTVIIRYCQAHAVDFVFVY